MSQLGPQLVLLPDLLGHHLLLTVAALACGIAVSMPLAIAAARVKRLRGPFLGLAGMIQTVPSLALLALMVPLLGMIGFVPAFIALVLYSILPVLRNTVTGVLGVEPALIEAARGLGMTPNQMLRKVQLPLAAPIIIAGIRTSAVWVVGIATLSTPVGAKSLGNYIFTGLATQNHTAVLVGCFAAAGLAIVLDGLIRLLETAAARRSKRLGAAALLAIGLLVGIGLAPMVSASGSAKPVVRIGAKTFTEQHILCERIAGQLEAGGFAVEKNTGMGSSILFNSLADSSIDCYVDYSGTLWSNVLHRTDSAGAEEVLEEVTHRLDREYGILCLGKLGFENTYALAMPREKAKKLGIQTIQDLASHAPGMKIAGDYEFFGRPEWKRVCDAYQLRFAENVSLNSTLMYSAAREDAVQVVAAFSTDGRLAAYDLMVLEDTHRAFPPYDAVILVSPKARRNRDLVEGLRRLVGSVSAESMRLANKRVDLDHLSPQEAARGLKDSIPR